MPAMNDEGKLVPVVADFNQLEAWLAKPNSEFRKVVKSSVTNFDNVEMEELHAYIGKTWGDFGLKTVLKDKDSVCQVGIGPWQINDHMVRAMSQIRMKLDNSDPNNPILVDDSPDIICQHGYRLRFAGNWFVKSWRLELMVKENRNQVREVELIRDEIVWERNNTEQENDSSTDIVSTATYWLPYD